MSVSSYYQVIIMPSLKNKHLKWNEAPVTVSKEKQNPQPDVLPDPQNSVRGTCHLLGGTNPIFFILHSVICSFQALFSLPPNNKYILLYTVMFPQYLSTQSITYLELVFTGCWALF